MNELLEFANKFVAEHPQHKDEVNDLLQLCFDEIEEGGSSANEIQLCRTSIEQLLES